MTGKQAVHQRRIFTYPALILCIKILFRRSGYLELFLHLVQFHLHTFIAQKKYLRTLVLLHRSKSICQRFVGGTLERKLSILNGGRIHLFKGSVPIAFQINGTSLNTGYFAFNHIAFFFLLRTSHNKQRSGSCQNQFPYIHKHSHTILKFHAKVSKFGKSIVLLKCFK